MNEMGVGIIILVVAVLAALGYVLGRRRALSLAGKSGAKLHSLPGYYGQTVALFVLVPALLLLIAWLFLQPVVINNQVSGMIPDSAIPDGGARSLVMSDVRRIAGGLDAVLAADGISEADLSEGRVDFSGIRGRLAAVGVALGSDVSAPVFEAAKSYWKLAKIGNLAMTIDRK